MRRWRHNGCMNNRDVLIIRLGPTPTLDAALLLPLAAALVVPWWRGKCTPTHYIKAPRRDVEDNTQQQATCLLSSLPGAPPSSPPLSLSLSRGLLKGCIGAR
jgi:hypothetical protein